MDNYLQSLGMRLAMNVITSCIAFAAHSLDLVHVKMWYGEGGVLETYKTMSSFIGTQFLYGAALVGIGTLMHNAGKNFLKKNMGEVEQEICAAIDALLRNRGQELRAIFASDSLEKGKRVEALFVSAYEISRNYYKRFGGVKKEVTNAVVSKVVHSAGILPALGASAALGAGMAINGYLNYKELIPDFVNAFDSAISSSAAGAIRSREIMNRKLRATFGTDTTTQLDAFLQRQGLFGEGQADFDYDHCEKFKEVDFLEFGDKKSAVMSACESVSKLMNSATASVRTAELGDKLKYIVLGNAKNMIMSEIVSPLSGVATGYFANYATDWIKEAHADSKMNDVKVEADKQQRKFEEKNKQYTTSQQKSGDTTDKRYFNAYIS